MGLQAESPRGLRWKINQASPGRWGVASFVGKNRKIHPGNRKSLVGQAPLNKPHPPNKSIREVIAHFNPPFCLLTATWRDTVGVMIYIYIPTDQTLLVFDRVTDHRLSFICLFTFNGRDVFKICY